MADNSIKYEVVQSLHSVDGDTWAVEGIDYARDGVVYVANFTGPLAETRAREYAEWKNGGRD